MSNETKHQTIHEDDDELIFADEDDEELVFIDENEKKLISPTNNSGKLIIPEIKRLTQTTEDSWKILVVDDESEIHNVTKLVLNDLSCEGKPISFINAYSAEEAKVLIAQHPDTALILVDVVMETDDAGLEVVK